MPGLGIPTGFSASTQGGAPRATLGTISLQKQTKETKEGGIWQCGAVRSVWPGRLRQGADTQPPMCRGLAAWNKAQQWRKEKCKSRVWESENRRNNAQESQKDRSFLPFCTSCHFAAGSEIICRNPKSIRLNRRK